MHEFSQEVLPRPSEPADLMAQQACQTEKAGSELVRGASQQAALFLVLLWVTRILGCWRNNNILAEAKLCLQGVVTIPSTYSPSTVVKSRALVQTAMQRAMVFFSSPPISFGLRFIFPKLLICGRQLLPFIQTWLEFSDLSQVVKLV